jgi:hypothetical protein
MNAKYLFVLLALTASAPAFAADADASKTFPTPQSAEGAMAPHVGLVGGFADQTGAYKPSVAYGVDAGFQPYIPFGLGIQALFYNSSYDLNNTVPGYDREGLKRVEIMLRGTYNFGGDNAIVKGMYVGGKVGAVINKPYIENNAGNDTSGNTFTRLGIAPVIGGDYMLGTSRVSLGVEVSYLFVTGPESEMDTFQALVSAKYWF